MNTVLHVASWIAVFVFYTLYFSRGESSWLDILSYAGLLLPITITTTYLFTWFLVPRYLAKRAFLKFSLLGLIVLMLSADLELIITIWLHIIDAVQRGDPIRPVAFDVWGLILAQYLVVMVFVTVDFFVRWYKAQGVSASLEKAHLESELKLKEAELKLLKAQIQPHFLFNTLNSLYALTLERSPDAPEMVLQLSGMLDYVLHRSDKPLVPLSDEMEHLHNYIHLEQVRYGDRLSVSFEKEGTGDDHKIAPLLLIPLVENAFKHGVAGSSGSASVDIHLQVFGGKLNFSVTNSVGPRETPGPVSGIGLQNLRKRLDLLYPARHQLNVDDGEDAFAVELLLELDDGAEA